MWGTVNDSKTLIILLQISSQLENCKIIHQKQKILPFWCLSHCQVKQSLIQPIYMDNSLMGWAGSLDFVNWEHSHQHSMIPLTVLCRSIIVRNILGQESNTTPLNGARYSTDSNTRFIWSAIMIESTVSKNNRHPLYHNGSTNEMYWTRSRQAKCNKIYCQQW